MNWASTILCVLLSLPLSAAPPLSERIQALVQNSTVAAPGSVGIQVVDARSGKLLYAIGGQKLFIPASNTKLFSTALALARLGPEYRFDTVVAADSAPDSSGAVHGDLYLRGYGDPTMSDQQIPYQRKSPPVNPLQGIEELADRVVAQGVRTIWGDVIGDDSAYVWEPYPPSWATGDIVGADGAPVSALTLNSNSFTLNIQPGATPGDPAVLTLFPALEYFAIDNRLRTVARGAEAAIHVERSENSRQLRLWGSVPAGREAYTRQIAVDDPALYSATALWDALTRRGVTVLGKPAVRHRHADEAFVERGGIALGARKSPALSEVLKVTDKVSENLWAEIVLREVGRVRHNDGSRRGGLAELKAFLTELGVPADQYDIQDGSGLSRSVLIAPAAITRLLVFMNNSPNAEVWRGLLPIGGQDGTLANRFDQLPAAAQISAKTGSLNHVNALSGYAHSATYGDVAFSILVNNTSAKASDVRAFIDKIGLTLLE